MNKSAYFTIAAVLCKPVFDYTTTLYVADIRPHLRADLNDRVNNGKVTWNEIENMRESDIVFYPRHYLDCGLGCEMCQHNMIVHSALVYNAATNWLEMSALERFVSTPPFQVLFT